MVEICHPYVELITNHPLLIQQKRKSSFGPAALQHGFDQKSTSISLVCLTIWDKVGKMKTNGTIAYCWLAEVFCTCWEIQDIHPNRQWTEHFSNCDCAGQQSVPRGVRGWGQQDRVATLVSDIWGYLLHTLCDTMACGELWDRYQNLQLNMLGKLDRRAESYLEHN